MNNRRFFVDELSKHAELHVVPCIGEYDCKGLDCDVVILWSLLLKNIVPMGLSGFEDLKCVKVTRAPDAWEIDKFYNETAKKLGIDLVVSFQSPNCQYQYLNKDIPYKRLVLGIDGDTYKCPKNWDRRYKDSILSSGVLPGPMSWTWFYHFRWKCAQHPGVHHIAKKDFLGVDYWKLLTQYRAAIACMTLTSVLKYFEIPMCGCLMFAESTRSNQIEDLGFKDGVNCVFIDRKNHKKRFEQYLATPDASVWREIAEEGRQLVLDNYTNERQVKEFVQTVKSMAAAKSRKVL